VTVQRILDCGVIAIIRASNPAGLVEAAEAIVAGGVTVVEFTLTTPEAARELVETVRVARER
jgi:2-dehydro-3-deoxyphosphogluconate aldolase/(4S)-4-hydroxy-2-oxoglutarate aldolase